MEKSFRVIRAGLLLHTAGVEVQDVYFPLVPYGEDKDYSTTLVEKSVTLKWSVGEGNPKIFSSGEDEVSMAEVRKLSQRQLIAARRQTQNM